MQRVVNPPNNLFVNGNPAEGTPGTIVTAEWLNAVQEELANIIEMSGGELNPEDNAQIAKRVMHKDWVDVRGYNNSISAALDAIGDVDAILYVAGGVSLDTDTTIPENIGLKIRYPGTITLGDYNLTINGPFEGSPACFIYNGVGSVSFSTSSVDVRDPVWFGFSTTALGVENQTSLNNAIAACAPGDVLRLRPGIYTVAGRWTINKACKIDLNGATLHFSTDAEYQGVYMTSSDCEIFNGSIKGPQHAVSKLWQSGIYATGTGPSGYISNINIHDLTIHGWGFSGVSVGFTKDFHIERVSVYDISHRGIEIRSCMDGIIAENIVHDIDDGNANPNSYGIVVTKGEGPESSHPPSKRINVCNNVVYNVKYWEALDTHGGEEISFIGNTVRNCRMGLMIGSTSDFYSAPTRCKVIGNTFSVDHSVVPIMETTYGITILGARADEYAGVGNRICEDSIVEGNIITGFASGIYSRNSRNTVIKGNTISDLSSHGIYLLGETINIVVSENAIYNIDPDVGICGIWINRGSSGMYPGDPSGVVSNNSIEAGALPGIYANDNLGEGIEFINNRIVTSGYPYHSPATYPLTYFHKIVGYFRGRTSFDFNSIPAGGSASFDVSVPGISISSSFIKISASRSLEGMVLEAFPGANIVTVKLSNPTSGAIDLGATNFFIQIDHYGMQPI